MTTASVVIPLYGQWPLTEGWPGCLPDALRARCPEPADEPDRIPALEPAFQHNGYLPFQRQVWYTPYVS